MIDYQTPSDVARGFFVFRDAEGRCWLADRDHPDVGALRADWLGAEQARRIAGGKRQLLARAIGLGRRNPLRVLDATGGLGRDACTLAALGVDAITVVERSPLIHALLADALEQWQAARPERPLPMTLLHADAHSVLTSGARWDVVYLDPMYPHRNKTALPSKEMQFFRALTGGDGDADALLAPARAAADWRVVVKRPLHAPPLAGQPPDQCLKGTRARFDLYLRSPCATSP